LLFLAALSHSLVFSQFPPGKNGMKAISHKLSEPYVGIIAFIIVTAGATY
jgi:hypothetical protein